MLFVWKDPLLIILCVEGIVREQRPVNQPAFVIMGFKHLVSSHFYILVLQIGWRHQNW